MRIFSSSYELMSEMGRELNSYGQIVRPKTYQNKVIEGNDDFVTKEIICQQYCLTNLEDPVFLFYYSHSKEWADAEFAERTNMMDYINPGEAWKLRKDLWEQFLVHGKFDYTYNERIIHVIKPLIELLQNDPDTRKAVLPIFNGDQDGLDTDWYDGERRIPCSMYYDFLIRENTRGEKVMNICYHQRSSDFIQHFGNDVYLAWRLMEFVAEKVGVKSGYLYHTIDSLHAYKKDWVKLGNSLRELTL